MLTFSRLENSRYQSDDGVLSDRCCALSGCRSFIGKLEAAVSKSEASPPPPLTDHRRRGRDGRCDAALKRLIVNSDLAVFQSPKPLFLLFLGLCQLVQPDEDRNQSEGVEQSD